MGEHKRKRAKAHKEAESLDEDDWIIVKKQRVSIIVPSISTQSPAETQRTLGEEPTRATRDSVEKLQSLEEPKRFFSGSVVINKRQRAMLLEKKIEKAGGLSKWLESMGLKSFVQMFGDQNVSKFVLVNLTMSKLKHMGANAVGPRRRLLHAMDCVCQPHCFQSC